MHLTAADVALELHRAAGLGSSEAALTAAVAARQACSDAVWLFVMHHARYCQFHNGTVCHMAAAANLWQLFRFFCTTGASPRTLNSMRMLPSETAADAGHVCTAVHIRCVYEA